MIKFILTLVLLTFIEVYAFMGLRNLMVNLDPMWRRVWTVLYWLTTFLVYACIVYMMIRWSQRHDGQVDRNYGMLNFFVGFFLLCLTTKLLFSTFHLLNDVTRFGKWAYVRITEKPDAEPHEGMTRVQFFNQMGLGVAALWAGTMLYGMTKGKYAYRVLSETLTFPDLPEAFDGMRIIQISDMHLGSFREAFDDVQPGFDLINSLNPDYIFFTGDMVNNFADEAEPWIDRLKGLKANYGKFSILGNHDYGDYAMGDRPVEKAKSQQRLFEIHAESGFQLLRNQNVKLERNGQSIRLLGSENWGVGFHQYGDLNKTLEGASNEEFKILLSHDPTHWSEHVLGKHNIHLTLSGHTHGAQMGLELPQFGIKFSPVSIRYKRWGGLYSENNQHLYINRGFGFLGFPGRIGMAPEITLIEFKRG